MTSNQFKFDTIELDGIASLWRRGIWPRAKVAEDVATKTLAKPQMRNLLRSQIKRNLATAIFLSCLGGYSYKHFVADWRRAKYAEFHRTFDAEAVAEDIRRKGYFQSC